MTLPPPHTVLIVLRSIKDRPLEESLLKQLLDFGILFELIETSAKHRSPLPPQKEIFCIIAEPHSSCLALVQKDFSHIPTILIPPAGKPAVSLKNLSSAARLPYPTLAVGKAGEVNAALFAASLLGIHHPIIRKKLHTFRKRQTSSVLAKPDPSR